MYLSRIKLNENLRATMRALAKPQIFHGAIESCFRGDRRRNLWRIDWIDNNCFLLVLSDTKVDFTQVVNQFGFTNSKIPWETKDYEPFLAMLSIGQVWQFRLIANPVHAVKEKGASGRGKIYAHVTPEQQKGWLIMRSNSLGFSLDENTFDVVHSEWKKFYKGHDNNRNISLRMVSFEGLLTITNVNQFCTTLREGVGRGKAYGLGMLTITKPHIQQA